MDEQLARIAHKLRIAGPSGAASPVRRVGRKNDPHVLNPPLAIDEVVAFEREHQVQLPEPYRRFITEIGDGDSDSGLYSLAEAYDDVRDKYFIWDHLFGTVDDPLRQPSLLRPDETYRTGWWNDHHGPDERPDPMQGTLPIQEGGCSDFYLMVLNGSAAGAVYAANWDGNSEPTWLADDYLTWYEDRMDRLVLNYTARWGVRNASRNEATVLRRLAEDPAPYRRMYAAWSLRRVTELSPQALDALEAAAADEHYVVRAISLQTIGHRKLRSLEPAVRRALADPSGEVRNWAFRVLCEFDVPDLSTVAAAALDSPDGWMREYAIEVLGKRKALTVAMVSRLLDHPEWTTRRQAVRHLDGVDGPVTGLLLKALDEPDHYFRNEVIDIAVAHGRPAITAKLRRMLDTTTDDSLAWKLEFALGLRQPGQTGPVR